MTDARPEYYLRKADPILGKVIDRVTLEPLHLHNNYFRSLIEGVISQQLSVKAADTIFARFTGLFPATTFPDPHDIIEIPLHHMRSIGLSGQKAHYIKHIAQARIAGTIDFANLHTLPDQEIIIQLTRIKGIGQWTAEMFLLFSLGRPDVFSYGDLGLRNAIKNLYNLRKEPSPARAATISRPWRPYRSLASRYLWASLSLKS